MILIVGIAVGLVALRNASAFWASATATVVVVAVATSVVGALTLRGRERYTSAGFAAFSGVYLAVALGTVLSDLKDYLGPTVALRYVESKVVGDQSDPWLRQRTSILRQLAALRQSDEEGRLVQRANLEAKLAIFDERYQQGQASRIQPIVGVLGFPVQLTLMNSAVSDIASPRCSRD
jgi:hypothetical protein